MKRAQHPIQRAKERYDLDLTFSDIVSIVSCIQNNMGKLIARGSNGESMWKLKWRKKWMRVVMDKSLYKVLTILPLSGPRHMP